MLAKSMLRQLSRTLSGYSSLSNTSQKQLEAHHCSRYYTPDSQPPPTAEHKQCASSSRPTLTATSSGTCPSTAVPESLELPPSASLLSHDPTLTAFAQLAAFRLDCERGFISLIDHEQQYVLAEATRSISLLNPE